MDIYHVHISMIIAMAPHRCNVALATYVGTRIPCTREFYMYLHQPYASTRVILVMTSVHNVYTYIISFAVI